MLGGIGTMLLQSDQCPACGRVHTSRFGRYLAAMTHGFSGHLVSRDGEGFAAARRNEPPTVRMTSRARRFQGRTAVRGPITYWEDEP